jgi:hypothetical protein
VCVWIWILDHDGIDSGWDGRRLRAISYRILTCFPVFPSVSVIFMISSQCVLVVSFVAFGNKQDRFLVSTLARPPALAPAPVSPNEV